MREVVSRVFTGAEEAERAVDALLAAGVPRDAIAVVSRELLAEPGGVAGGEAAVEAGKGAVTGLGVGAGAGALFGLAALAIPGAAPFLAAGALADLLGVIGGAAATGAVVGGTGGALAGLFHQWGMDASEARRYESEVEQGGVFVGVDVSNSPVSRAAVEAILRGEPSPAPSGTAGREVPSPDPDAERTRFIASPRAETPEGAEDPDHTYADSPAAPARDFSEEVILADEPPGSHLSRAA